MLKVSDRSHLTLTLSLIVITWIILWHVPAMAVEEINKTYFGVAINGYDTVAYFTEDRAIKGNQNISHIWNDAKWYFASEQNRNLFAADPEKYAPQYGGH